MGDISVGVMQLHNKLEGRNVTMEDMNRIEQIGKFIGALSIKAQYITQSLTVSIGLMQNCEPSDLNAKDPDALNIKLNITNENKY